MSPETAKFITESILHTPKEEVYFHDYQEVLSGRLEAEQVQQVHQVQDPPPLYTKDPPEGGIVGWMAVAGA